tara:strand:- start:3220 stop:3411 length:192 start_codon:yes stop_codon:yes gene_type:complete
MPKYDRNGVKPKGRKIKPADRSCAGECQYKIKEESVDRKKVKEKDVFDKGLKKKSTQKSRRRY